MECIFSIIVGAFILAPIRRVWSKNKNSVDDFSEVIKRLSEFYVLRNIDGKAAYKLYKRYNYSYLGTYNWSDLRVLDERIRAEREYFQKFFEDRVIHQRIDHKIALEKIKPYLKK